MTLEQQVEAPESTQNQSGDIAQERSEFATPEADFSAPADETAAPAEPEKPKESDAERIQRQTQRRIDKLVRERETARAEARQLREAQERAQQRQPEGQQEQQRFDPRDVEQQARQIVERERFDGKCNDVFASAVKEFPGFEASYRALTEEVPMFEDGRPTPLIQAVLDTDAPHKVLHHLAQNPDLAAELAEMSPIRQARRIGQLERDLDKPKATTSAAPKPLTPVKPTASKPEVSADDTERWIEERNRQQYGR